jgi:lysozyme family protein
VTLWDAAIRTLLEVEGGYVNHPTDPGGETKFGISKRSYPTLDIPHLTRDDAARIYRRDYWDRVPDGLPDDLHWMVFDSAVNHGVARALAWLQEHDTLPSYTAHRLVFYTGLSTWATFGRGWARRVAHVLKAIDAYTTEHGRVEVVPTVVLDGLRVADRWVALTTNPVKLRGRFVVRWRPGKVDIRRDA